MAHPKITGEALQAYNRLGPRFQQDIEHYMESNPRAVLLSHVDVVDAWLTWNGIINYTSHIVALVTGAFGKE